MKLSSLSDTELINLYPSLLDELKKRDNTHKKYNWRNWGIFSPTKLQ